jgi:hypothetical protein
MMRIDHRETDLENHDRGLDYDLPRLLHRRGMLKLVAGVGLAGAGLITLGACGSDATRKAATPVPSDINTPCNGEPNGISESTIGGIAAVTKPTPRLITMKASTG